MTDPDNPSILPLLLCYAAMMCLAIAVNLAPVFLTTWGSAFGGAGGLTNEQLGRIGAATFIGLVLGLVAAGPLADRLGPRRFAVAGNLLVAGGLAVLGVAGSYEAVLAGVFVMGAGAGVLDMVLSPIVCALQPQRRTTAMNWLHAFYCIGAVGTVLVAATAMRLGAPWRWIALGLIVFPVAVSAGFAAVKIAPLVAHGQERTRLRDLAFNPFFLGVLAAIFLAGSTELAVGQWLPAYARKGLGYSDFVGGMAFLAFSLAMAAGRVAMGVLAHRVRVRGMMLAAAGLSAGLFVAGGLLPWPPLALVACVAIGLTVSCLWPCTLALAGDRFPHGGASMFGSLAAVGNFGGIVAPWLVGMAADWKGMNFALAAAALFPLLLTGLLACLGRSRDQGRPPMDNG
jgi:fucose permease